MNGIHDLGGMHGFGPIDREEHDRADWEWDVALLGRVTQRQRLYNLDAFRYGIECMDPADYLRASYFERWLATIEFNLERAGVLAPGEVDDRLGPDAPVRRSRIVTPDPIALSDIAVPLSPAGDPPRFTVGDAVITRTMHPTGHTRLPRYARGKRGVINLVHSAQIFPDTHAHGLGEHPQPVYNVRFDGQELWGDSAEPRQTVAIDLWESYLEPADAAVEGN